MGSRFNHCRLLLFFKIIAHVKSVQKTYNSNKNFNNRQYKHIEWNYFVYISILSLVLTLMFILDLNLILKEVKFVV